MSQDTLFDTGDDRPSKKPNMPEGEVRLKRANRDQALMSPCAVDE